MDLTEAQRDTLIAAKADGYLWRVDIRSAGWRGLPTRGLAYGRADASRMPGMLGVLTPKGERVRDTLAAHCL